MSRFLFFIVWLVLFACQPAQLAAAEVAITILHTTDLHGHIRSANSPALRETFGQDVGGLARVATMIKKIRAETPHCLLVDNGDTIQGTAASFLSDGMMMVRAMNHLHYDAWVWGNHDFDWGLEKLAACAAASEAPVVACNIQGNVPGITDRLRPFLIKELGGVRVAILGMTTPGIPNWSRPRLIHGLQFAASADAVSHRLPDLKHQKPDLILLAAHQGYRGAADDHANQLHSIVTWFPEIQFIIGGHTHQPVPELMLQNILYTQANYWGTHLGRIDLIYDTSRRAVVRRRAQLIPIDHTVPPDPELMSLCQPALAAADRELARVVGHAVADFPPVETRLHETALHNLLCESILERCRRAGHPADIVLHSVLDESVGLKKGPITIGNCWGLVPFENNIGVFEATPAQLREILEEDADHFLHDHFTGVYGLKMSLKVSAPRGQRVVSMTDRDGRPWTVDRRLRVAVNSFDLASAGNRKPRLRAIAEAPEARLVEIDYQVRQALIDLVQLEKQITPHLYGWWRVGGN